MRVQSQQVRLVTVVLSLALVVGALVARRALAVPDGHFVVNGDGTVTDTATGLMWQQSVPVTGASRAGGSGNCTALELGGHTDWRLPHVAELLSIVEEQPPVGNLTALDPTAFPQGGAVGFWSSTTFRGNTNSSWIVDFSAGYSGTRLSTDTYRIRCVRTLAP